MIYTSNTLEEVKKIITNENIPNQILEILIFGSIVNGKITNQSDIDILIIHSSKEVEEYLAINEFIKNLKKKIVERTKRLTDIFLTNDTSSKFILNISNVYLAYKKTFITIYKKNKLVRSLSKKRYINLSKKKAATSSAIILLLDIINSIPDIDYKKRRNNLKKISWFSQHINFLEPTKENISKKLSTRLKNIEKEDFASMCDKDMKMLNFIFKQSKFLDLSVIDLKTFYAVQLCQYYFIELKRFNSAISSQKIDINSTKHFFCRGLSLILKTALAYNSKEVLWMKKKSSHCYFLIFQQLTDFYVNESSHKEIKTSTKKDLASLLFLLDFVIFEIFYEKTNYNHK
jgi:predicted nucleotidyltransferase